VQSEYPLGFSAAVLYFIVKQAASRRNVECKRGSPNAFACIKQPRFPATWHIALRSRQPARTSIWALWARYQHASLGRSPHGTPWVGWRGAGLASRPRAPLTTSPSSRPPELLAQCPALLGLGLVAGDCCRRHASTHDMTCATLPWPCLAPAAPSI
jgi:hypothetical protein